MRIVPLTRNPNGRFATALARPAALALAALGALVAHSARAQDGLAPIRDPEHFTSKYVWSYKALKQNRIVMQKLDYSCGAAVLATIIRYYWGDNVDESTFLDYLPKLKLTEAQARDRVENGLTLTDLRNIANMAGYDATMGKIQFNQLAASKIPVVVGIRVNEHDHFVAFRGTDWRYAYLADPIRGNVRTPIPVFLTQWQRNLILVVAKRDAPALPANPMAVRQDDVDRGWLNDQLIRQNPLMPLPPNPIGIQ